MESWCSIFFPRNEATKTLGEITSLPSKSSAGKLPETMILEARIYHGDKILRVMGFLPIFPLLQLLWEGSLVTYFAGFFHTKSFTSTTSSSVVFSLGKIQHSNSNTSKKPNLGGDLLAVRSLRDQKFLPQISCYLRYRRSFDYSTLPQTSHVPQKGISSLEIAVSKIYTEPQGESLPKTRWFLLKSWFSTSQKAPSYRWLWT